MCGLFDNEKSREYSPNEEAPLPNPASSKNSNSIRSSSLVKPDTLEEDDEFDKIERSVFTVSLVSKPVIIEELLPLPDEEEEEEKEEEEGRRALKEEYEETNMSSINIRKIIYNIFA
jgi:hypothetical protein